MASLPAPRTFSYEELLLSAEGRLFGPAAPRLPLPPMLMLDRVTRAAAEGGPHGAGEIAAEKDIAPDLWFFACHFKGDPVMPGCLGLDGLWQLAGFFLSFMGLRGRGRALGVGELKFSGEVTPATRRIIYRIAPRRLARRAGLLLADGELEADGEIIYRASGLRVLVAPAEEGAEEAAGEATGEGP